MNKFLCKNSVQEAHLKSLAEFPLESKKKLGFFFSFPIRTRKIVRRPICMAWPATLIHIILEEYIEIRFVLLSENSL